MNRKGFTLLELLAVILVLSMIALIAIPAVTKVIDQSRKGATETTVLNFIKAVNDKIGTSRLDSDKSNDILDGILDVSTINLHMEGKIPTSGTVTVSGGAVVSADVELNGYSVSCESIEKCTATKDNAEKETYVYYAGVGSEPKSDSEKLSSRPSDKNVYMRFIFENNIYTKPEICLYFDDKEECFAYNDYENSKSKFLKLVNFSETSWNNEEENNEWYKNGDSSYHCSLGNSDNMGCDIPKIGFSIGTNGSILVQDTEHRYKCEINQFNVPSCTTY